MSKIVYVAGSFKNLEKMAMVVQQFRDSGIDTLISEPLQSNGIEGCLERIRKSDITYILNYNGYVGKSVAMDIGYALGLEKTIYALEPIADPDITHLISGVISPNALVNSIKNQK
ncbi:nucleotide pyrophosphohydrolase [Vibrio jasicida]|uniref:nucleotide pyrophosphohydrolase n=1 Tax=Vibrio jasicida TaxID=766224 RepID=UPI0005F03E22|nr:nucleotide pyrophosphohydrolase [Vibrio jasicida]